MRTFTTPRGPDARRNPCAPPRDVPLPMALRSDSEIETKEASKDPFVRSPQMALVEAVLLIADEPLPPRKLAQTAGLADAAAVRKVVKGLRAFYEKEGSAFQVEELAGGFQLLTRPEFHRWLAPLRRGQQELKLTGPARETLAIVAYRQPITRADLEAIRGVNAAETLRLLMEKGFVRIAGRDDSLGRPVLYGTTKKFLQVFGLKSLKDLPRRDQILPGEGSSAD